ncbi:MAG TPA: hypothetical protein ENK91_09980 [Bacteroidetes bacterium]|nr:hypothetical protein [Bacteroidota bacterium]
MPNIIYTYDGEEIFSMPDSLRGKYNLRLLLNYENLYKLNVFTANQYKKINSLGIRIYNDENKRDNFKSSHKNNYYLIDYWFKKIAGPFKSIKRIGTGNLFLIKTYNKKYGILKVEKL